MTQQQEQGRGAAWTEATTSDRLEIEDLLCRYLNSLDGGDIDAFVDVFAPDGAIKSDEGESGAMWRGPDELREFVTARAGVAFHMTTDSSVTVDGDTGVRIARFLAFPTKWRGEGGIPVVTWIGHSRDEVVRTPKGWRIALREIWVSQGPTSF